MLQYNIKFLQLIVIVWREYTEPPEYNWGDTRMKK
jgi:hypothetical protein